MNSFKSHRLVRRSHILHKDSFSWSKLLFIRNSDLKKNILRTNQTSSQRETVKLTAYNPISELQQFVAVPIIPEDQVLFNPLDSEIKASKRLFVHVEKQHEIRHIKTAASFDRLPVYNMNEVAFLGRSNVGKSSLIKALFSDAPRVERSLVVSKKPGRTKALQLYQAGKAFTLVDMPGYGFHMPAYFKECVETYLKDRKKLVRTFALIDSTTGIEKYDIIGLNMLEEFTIPYVMVLTKIDKAQRHQLIKTLMTVMEYRDKHTKYCTPQPFLVSSHSGAGLALLQSFITYLTGNFKVTES